MLHGVSDECFSFISDEEEENEEEEEDEEVTPVAQSRGPYTPSSQRRSSALPRISSIHNRSASSSQGSHTSASGKTSSQVVTPTGDQQSPPPGEVLNPLTHY